MPARWGSGEAASPSLGPRRVGLGGGGTVVCLQDAGPSRGHPHSLTRPHHLPRPLSSRSTLGVRAAAYGLGGTEPQHAFQVAQEMWPGGPCPALCSDIPRFPRLLWTPSLTDEASRNVGQAHRATAGCPQPTAGTGCVPHHALGFPTGLSAACEALAWPGWARNHGQGR